MIDATPFWGVVGVVVLVISAIMSVPIAAALGAIGVFMLILFYGDMKAVMMTASSAWFTSASYTLSLLPLFIWMGEIASSCGIGDDAFDCFHKWLSKIRGALAVVCTVSCAFFGAVTGSTSGTIATIGGIALPIMKRLGYHVQLRTGVIAVAGVLANLIPPSVVAIIYCSLTDQSIGKVFMAGLIPGFILTMLLSFTVMILVRVRRELAPDIQETYTLKEKLASSKGPIPIIIIFIFLFWGIYAGIFSPTEAGALGVAGTMVVCMILRRLTFKKFKKSLMNAIRTSAFIMILMMGGVLFSKAVVITNLPNVIAEFVLGLSFSKYILIAMIMFVFLLFGCVLDSLGLSVLLIPLWYPTIVGMGYSPIWYGTFCVVLVEIGLITPPVAANLYITQTADGDATTLDVIKGTLPFYVACLTFMVLLVLFPSLATWLPSKM